MFTTIKRKISRQPIVIKTYNAVIDYLRNFRQWDGDLLSEYNSSKKGIIKFIQIGSNNGLQGDPINQYIKNFNWEGILVEPVPYIFDELKENYKDFSNKLQFENCAVASRNGTLKFYRLQKSNDENLPVWYDQLGSFNKEVVLRHRGAIPNFDNLLIEENISTITFSNLVEKHEFKTIDLLHIDTEGYDQDIIKSIPFNKYQIELIMFESKHMSLSIFYGLKRFLKKYDYIVKCMSNGDDAIAIKNFVLKKIERINTEPTNIPPR